MNLSQVIGAVLAFGIFVGAISSCEMSSQKARIKCIELTQKVLECREAFKE